MFYLKLLCKACYVTQTKVGMPWLLEDQEVNTVLRTSETPLIKDLPLWQKHGHAAVNQAVLLLHGCTISVSFLTKR